MKNLLLLLAILTVATADATENVKPAKIKKYMKKLGLQKHEMYYTTKTELAKVYAANGELSFPLNAVFNNEGREVKAVYKEGGKEMDMLTCFGTFVDDWNRYINDTEIAKYVATANHIEQEKQLFHPVYSDAVQNIADHNLIIYYPSGMPIIRKQYAELSETIKTYRQKGKDIAVYLVIVPVFKKS